MKKSIRGLGFWSLLPAFFLLGVLLFSSGSAHAQASLDQTLDLDQNWKPEPEAAAIIEGVLIQVGGELANMNPDNPLYNTVENRLYFFKQISGQLGEGDTVKNSVLYAVDRLNDTKTTTMSMAGPNELLQLYNEAVGILAN